MRRSSTAMLCSMLQISRRSFAAARRQNPRQNSTSAGAGHVRGMGGTALSRLQEAALDGLLPQSLAIHETPQELRLHPCEGDVPEQLVRAREGGALRRQPGGTGFAAQRRAGQRRLQVHVRREQGRGPEQAGEDLQPDRLRERRGGREEGACRLPTARANGVCVRHGLSESKNRRVQTVRHPVHRPASCPRCPCQLQFFFT